MAKAEEILTQSILELLVQKPEGLEVEEVLQHLAAGDSGVSPRGVRNLLNRLVKEGKLEMTLDLLLSTPRIFSKMFICFGILFG